MASYSTLRIMAMAVAPVSTVPAPAAAPYAERRAELMRRLGPGGALVLASPPEHLRNGDTHFKFRQDSDILYLTGFEEPGTVVVLRPGHETMRFVLFVRPRDPAEETWTGRRAGVDGAVRDFGADAAFVVAELDEKLAEIVGGAQEIHFPFGREPALDAAVARLLGRLRVAERRGRAGARAAGRRARDVARDAPHQVAARGRDPASRRRDHRGGAHRRHARREDRGRRARDRGADRLHVPQERRHRSRVSDDRRWRRQRDDPPLRREPRPAGARAAPADRCGLRDRRLHRRRDEDVADRRAVLTGAAAPVRGRAGDADRRDRGGQAGRDAGRDPQAGGRAA